MGKPIRRLVVSMFIMILAAGTGCGPWAQSTTIGTIQNEQTGWLRYEADQRGAYIRVHGICAEPPPDAAFNEVLKIAGTYKGMEGQIDYRKDVVQLAQATQTVMFLRESLYRLCEMSLSTDSAPTAADRVTLYMKVLETAKAIADASKIRELANAPRPVQISYEISMLRDQVADNNRILEGMATKAERAAKGSSARLLNAATSDDTSHDLDILKAREIVKENTAIEDYIRALLAPPEIKKSK